MPSGRYFQDEIHSCLKSLVASRQHNCMGNMKFLLAVNFCYGFNGKCRILDACLVLVDPVFLKKQYRVVIADKGHTENFMPLDKTSS
jgi:hypothetical protein